MGLHVLGCRVDILGTKGRGWPSTQVLTLRIIRAIKLQPNKKKEKKDRQQWGAGIAQWLERQTRD